MLEDLEIKMEKILSLIKDSTYTPMAESDIAFFMEVPEEEKVFFFEAIEKLKSIGKIVRTKKGKIILPERMNLVAGVYRANPKGFGFVVTDDPLQGDIFIPRDFTNGAMNKDLVLCSLLSSFNRRNSVEGEVVKVLQRGNSVVVGRYIENKGFAFVIPDDKKIPMDIFVKKENSKGAITGHKVAVNIIKPPSENRNPEGKVREILGHMNDPGIDILSIVTQLEIPVDFSDEVYEQIDSYSDEVTEQDWNENRKDLRELQMVTIDGEDAKDLDDAVSLEILENGNYQLGVHIADVTHYVQEGSPLDKNAHERATSVYLLDRVIPMLPHKLSNGICSLNAKTERLALSCIMEINRKGTVVSHEICESVIYVDKRMSYNIVADILLNKDSEYIEENKEFIPMFQNMFALSKILRGKRTKRGAIEFDFAECKVVLDGEGKPIEIKPYVRNIATSIIEEFMLICNETVAEEYFWLDLPFVYRNHAEPDSQKMDKLSKFISNFGYTIKGSAMHPKAIQDLLTKIENTDEEVIISRVILRSFQQARYSPNNEGHFGLAAKYYCHFTSPIRRYPDLQIHRIIKENLNGRLQDNRISRYKRTLPETTKHCSIAERRAEEAEREVNSLKKVEYMSDKVGQIFEGIISSVTSWGIFVELPNTVEGLIQIASLLDDYYEFDEKHLLLIGENTKNIYKLGDKIHVKLSRASIEERRLYFEVASALSS